MAEIVLITGMSGAGRSGVADVMDDLGWYVVDNLPTSLVERIVELAAPPGKTAQAGTAAIERLALVAGRDHDGIMTQVASVRGSGHEVTVVFLDASSSELVDRYKATRRRHPLADRAEGLLESIELERELLQTVRERADLVIDTTGLNVHQLKDRVVAAFSEAGTPRLEVAVESFGFKHGVPLDADIVMDVRFLPNPHWQADLRPLTGHDPAVRDYVLERAETSRFIESFDELLHTVVPGYQAEGRSYLTIAIGCTGGRHRSVAISEEIAARLRARGLAVRTSHRDLSR